MPRLVVEGVTCDDLCEGELGNTWFVSACSALAREPKLWKQVQRESFSFTNNCLIWISFVV